MSRRLVTDAKIVLERAGYECTIGHDKYGLVVKENNHIIKEIEEKTATVDNEEVIYLLSKRGFDQHGHDTKQIRTDDVMTESEMIIFYTDNDPDVEFKLGYEVGTHDGDWLKEDHDAWRFWRASE